MTFLVQQLGSFLSSLILYIMFLRLSILCLFLHFPLPHQWYDVSLSLDRNDTVIWLLYRLHCEERVHVVRKERKRRRGSRHGFRLLSEMVDLRRQIRCVRVFLESTFSWRTSHERSLSLTVWCGKVVTCRSEHCVIVEWEFSMCYSQFII